LRDTLNLTQIQRDRALINFRWRWLLNSANVGFIGLMLFGLVFTKSISTGDPSTVETAIIIIIVILALICGFSSTLFVTAPISWVLRWLIYRKDYSLRSKIPPYHFDVRPYRFWIVVSVATLLMMIVFPAAFFIPFVVGIALHYVFSYNLHNSLQTGDYQRALYYAALGKHWLPVISFYYWQYGELLVQADRLEEAIEYYKQILKTTPRFPLVLSSVMIKLADALSLSGKYIDAFPLLQDAVELVPDSIYHLHLINWYLEQDIELERCVELLDLGYEYPSYKTPWLLLRARTLNRIGEKGYSESNLKEALELISRASISLRNKAQLHLMVAKASREQGNLFQARSHLNRALSLTSSVLLERLVREELSKL